ncbi:two-component sensor histidine kinase [Planobispora rosea]|uniref:histidine kinase n=1 Tax=Planobispora rosea TaxID=35762 RepID=A0A8J3WBL5_PLARO|nr:ATP-binding protein [Planobispora rosea]GGS70422.1 two-component sensor histidine kinase [Planobispora rosea]GIH83270.1 two-component sensor histidine kinase [Planobispora rosea]
MKGRRSLRARLTVLVAATVAVAIAVCAGACWFIVRSALLEQVDRSLDGPRLRESAWIIDRCLGDTAIGDTPPPRDIPPPGEARPGLGERVLPRGLPPNLPPIQLVDAAGRVCAVGDTAIEVVPADLALAKAPKGAYAAPRDGVTEDGAEVRVMTRSIGSGYAVMEARELGEFQTTLTGLAGILAGVAGLGVVGAATAGRLIARTTLRPVERLTGAVEHIARTEDLGTRIPVEGTDEIARLGASFNAMTAALAGSRERQRRLVADAGHELRTPLTSLRTNVDLLLRSENTGRPLAPAARHRLLGSLKAQFEEMSTLIGDLLQLARGEEEHGPHAELAFHEVVGSAVDRARLRAGDIPIEVDVGPWYVRGDEAALQRAVVNLLDNAVKFSRAPADGPAGENTENTAGENTAGESATGGNATGRDSADGGSGGRGPVVVRLRGGELTVRDHGPGVAQDELPYVFDRFWRSSSARSMPGSGLGLAIVAQAVRDAGGEVVLENAPGGGALARLRLPGAGTLEDLSGSAAAR